MTMQITDTLKVLVEAPLTESAVERLVTMLGVGGWCLKTASTKEDDERLVSVGLVQESPTDPDVYEATDLAKQYTYNAQKMVIWPFFIGGSKINVSADVETIRKYTDVEVKTYTAKEALNDVNVTDEVKEEVRTQSVERRKEAVRKDMGELLFNQLGSVSAIIVDSFVPSLEKEEELFLSSYITDIACACKEEPCVLPAGAFAFLTKEEHIVLGTLIQKINIGFKNSGGSIIGLTKAVAAEAARREEKANGES